MAGLVGGTAPKNGAPGRIRTCGLRFRKPSLYPAELRVLTLSKAMMRGGVQAKTLAKFACQASERARERNGSGESEMPSSRKAFTSAGVASP